MNASNSLRSPMFRAVDGWPPLRLVEHKSAPEAGSNGGTGESGQTFMAKRTENQAAGKRAREFSSDATGNRKLGAAAREWAQGVRSRYPRHKVPAQVADVLGALCHCVTPTKSAKTTECLAELASLARKLLRSPECQFQTYRIEADGNRTLCDMSPSTTPETLDTIERWIINYRRMSSEWRKSDENVLTFGICELLRTATVYGPPCTEAVERIQQELNKFAQAKEDDPERALRGVLVAYGLPINKARNALKYRDMRAKRDVSIKR